MARKKKARDPELESKVFKKVNSEKEIAFDDDVVHSTGIETVSGNKVFVDDVYFGDGHTNNIIITNNRIKKMTDGSVENYYLPPTGGTLAIEGGSPTHTHSFLTSGDSVLSLRANGTVDVQTTVQGSRYYEWSARFNDSSNQFVPPIAYGDDPTHGGMFFVVRSFYSPGYDFHTDPLPETVDGEIEVYYHAQDAEYSKVIVAYRPVRFELNSEMSYYSATQLVGMMSSPITGRQYVFSQQSVPGTSMDWEDTYVYSMMASNFWNDYYPTDGWILLNLGPGGTFRTGSAGTLSEELIDTGSSTTRYVAFKDYVDEKIGSIDAILDEINGEVI